MLRARRRTADVSAMMVYEMGPRVPAKTKEMRMPSTACAQLVAALCGTEAQMPRMKRRTMLVDVPQR